jgi:hypothetical protein
VTYDLSTESNEFVAACSTYCQVMIELLLKWGNVSEKTGLLPTNPVPTLYQKLPDYILEDIIEFYMHIMHFSNSGWKHFPRDHILPLFKFCVVVLKSEKVISNPYIKAKILELMALFTAGDRKHEILPMVVGDSFLE